MRALVTGGSGFVGHYLVEALQGDGVEVVASAGPHESSGLPQMDLANGASVRAALDAARPDVVFHLAAQTFVPESFAAPAATYETNVVGTARLTQVMREYAAASGAMPRLVFASSAEVYGPRDAAEFPLRETLAPRPATPYAASKAAAEAIVLAEARAFGMDVVVARAFNHIGPGQSDRFVVPSLAAQLAAVAAGGEPLLLVGNLNAARDFLDVRDVVAAYVALARDGASGETYNVCSGTPVKIRDLLRDLIFIAGVAVEVREDPQRFRPLDVPVFFGSAEKLRACCGWSPSIPLARSLRDVYAAARVGNPRAPA